MNSECENRPHQTTRLLCKMDKWQHAFGLRWMSSLIPSGVEGKLKVPSVVRTISQLGFWMLSTLNSVCTPASMALSNKSRLS